MAKTFGTGADPKGLVARGVEGSGAAQIFRPSQAVQDFVSRQARSEQQRAAEKKAEAKAKAERQKELDKAFQSALNIEGRGWTEPINQEIAADFGVLQDMVAKAKMQGINPSDDKDIAQAKFMLELKMSEVKAYRDAWENASNKLYSMAANKMISKEDFNQKAQDINAFTKLPLSEMRNNLQLLEGVKVEPIYDYDKEVAKNVKNIAPDTKPTLDKGLGIIIHTTEVSPEKIEQGFNAFKTSPAYKQKKTELIENGVFDTEEETEEFLKNDYKIKFGKKTNYKGAGKGGLSVGFGGGIADTYKAEYRNISPESINIQNYGITPSEIILPKDKPKYLRSISLLSSDKKAAVPLTFNTNIRYKDPETGKNKDITSSTPITPVKLIEYKAINDTKYLFLFNIKGVGDAAAVIDDANKEDFQDYFLGDNETIESFLEKGESASKQQPTTTKPSGTSATPQKKTITTKTGKTLTVPK